MKLGIMQGRLTEPINGKIQEFPKNWKIEFTLLNQLGLNHIEWIITKNSFKTNPLFSDPLSQHPISSICADNLIDKHFINNEFLSKNLRPICEYTYKNKIKNITIPLLEDSSIKDKDKRKMFFRLIRNYANNYPQLNFSFELDISPKEILGIAKLSKNFFITYDTGNVTSNGLDHKEYILSLHKFINNIHLKDKSVSGESVPPGYGNVDFKSIFKLLKSFNYDGPYTIQTKRGETGKEQETIINNKQFFEKMYNDE